MPKSKKILYETGVAQTVLASLAALMLTGIFSTLDISQSAIQFCYALMIMWSAFLVVSTSWGTALLVNQGNR